MEYKNKIERWLSSEFSNLVNTRRLLHQIPEVGFEEYKTSEFCINYVKKLGLKPIQSTEMGTGFYVDYGFGKSKNCLAIRCDLDALPIQEKNKFDFISRHKGVSHACGHDVHMTLLLGILSFLAKNKIKIDGTIRFVFQPAEEIAPGGAEKLINAGVLNGVDHIIGAHVQPKLKPSQIGIKSGPMAAIVELVDFTIEGPGGHTSRPADTVDLVAVLSLLVSNLEKKINKKEESDDAVVLAFGNVFGGSTYNVLPDIIKLKGTLRYIKSDKKDLIHNKIKKIIHNIETSTGASISWNIPHFSPGLFNNKWLTDQILNSAIQIIGEDNVHHMKNSSMGGEDFAYYSEKIPGAYFRIGSNDGRNIDIHTPNFNVDEECIRTGLKVYLAIISNYFSIN